MIGTTCKKGEGVACMPEAKSSAHGTDSMKEAASERALSFVKSGMTLGLGTGSTVEIFLSKLANALRNRLVVDVWGVATSERTAKEAVRLGIPLTDLDDRGVDLCIDGADCVTPDLTLVKGYGGALFREKIVAESAREFIVIVDESKLVEKAGGRGFPIPVEIEPFGFIWTMKRLFETCGKPVLRRDEQRNEPFLTDGGHFIVDVVTEDAIDPERFETLVKKIPGVIESGIFLEMAHLALVGTPSGVREIRRQES
ncbi:MAG: Ribose-5-phosphate isomerase A [Synergistales bacterium 54_9]|nr:MAG: Ribose-5-phosphate isomerase A [Synergistales bacterium 54_9]